LKPSSENPVYIFCCFNLCRYGTVKLVPRFDYALLQRKEEGTQQGRAKPNSAMRPPARLLTEAMARQHNLSFERSRWGGGVQAEIQLTHSALSRSRSLSLSLSRSLSLSLSLSFSLSLSLALSLALESAWFEPLSL
jgi:hypothetical protein